MRELGEALCPRLFRALSDPSRLAILSCLASADGPCTVSEVASRCPIDLSVVSRHLATLRDAGVVVAEKRGRKVYYTLSARKLAASLRHMADALDPSSAAPE